MAFGFRLAARCGLFIVAFSLAACGSVPIPGGGGGNIEQAERAYAAGDFNTAADLFLAAAERSRGERRDYLTLRAAESHRQNADFAAVRQTTRNLRHSGLSDSQRLRLDLLLAEVALSENDYDAALGLLTVPPERVAERLRPRFHELRARAMVGLDDKIGAARERATQLPFLSEADQPVVSNHLVALLTEIPVNDLYRASAAMSGNDPLKVWADASLTDRGITPPRLLADGRDPMAPREPPPTDSEGRALYGKVALLVPLSGAIAPAGQAVRDGFMAAYGAAPEPRPQIEIIDAGGTGAEAVAAYRRALEQGAELVIGPLAREAVSELFRQPMLPVPVLALNHADGVAPPQGSVQFGLLPDEEALAAADRLARFGAQRVAIIGLPDDWSRRAAQAFRQKFEALGGTVVSDVRIGRNDYNFTARAETLRNENVDGLFLALHAQSARLLVPQLKSVGVGGTWLAMSRVYAGAPMAALDRDLDGLEFSDAPWMFGSVSGVPSRDELAGALRNVQGQALRLFAFGMDAWRLSGYIDWLTMRPYSFIPGATGELSIDGSRQVRRQLAWARFQGGIPVPVEGALSFDNSERIDEPVEAAPSDHND